MRTIAITQARMGSTRLPGKVLMEVAGKSLLAHHLERARAIPGLSEVVVATTMAASDDPIASCCEGLGVAVFRGSEHDVLGRFDGAALAHRADVVVRLTADCPLLDPEVSGSVVARFHAHGRKGPAMDFVSNTLQRTYPRGLDTEVFTRESLTEAASEATASDEREHVTAFIHRRPERYRIDQVIGPVDHSDLRWTVDEPADLDLVTRLLEAIAGSGDFSMARVLRLLAENPAWIAINAHVMQKR